MFIVLGCLYMNIKELYYIIEVSFDFLRFRFFLMNFVYMVESYFVKFFILCKVNKYFVKYILNIYYLI